MCKEGFWSVTLADQRNDFIMIRTAAVIAMCLMAGANAFSMVGTSVSAFGGTVLLSPMVTNKEASIQMKKGKPNLPPGMRGDYKRQREMSEMRQQMEAAQKPGEDGLPVFNLFVRTPVGNVWYPCGSFKGDEKSKALASNYRDNGILSGISKKQLDAGISGSLYRDIPKLNESIFRTYPQLRKSRDKLEYGYKLAFEGLSEEQSKVQIVEPKEQKGFMDGVKNMFG